MVLRADVGLAGSQHGCEKSGQFVTGACPIARAQGSPNKQERVLGRPEWVAMLFRARPLPQ